MEQDTEGTKNIPAKTDPGATSKETLSDLEETEKVSDNSASSDDRSVPTPDGQVEEGGSGRADGDTGGPM